ncbi:hypothetical protein HHI36_011841 [Cryptolaemus montrouzieri]|uniref:Uncharacterized protein n=1 Tax=Cryptolaemus montrouzieri TaxID=559131 RepID=A0ABD2ND93_9CUCU
MKYLIAAFLCTATVVADRLDNVYLPPTRSRTAGGNGNILNVPFHQRKSQVASYSTSSNFQAPLPGNSYIAPQNSGFNGNSVGPTKPPVAILRFNNENNGEGTYQFEFETENKIFQQESGQLKNVGTDQASNAVQGSYSYVGLDGNTYTVNYIADELGFRASGDHLPVAPPVPAEILKSLEQNAADEAKGIIDDGQYRSGASDGYKYGGAGPGRQYLAPKVQGGYQQQQKGYKY